MENFPRLTQTIRHLQRAGKHARLAAVSPHPYVVRRKGNDRVGFDLVDPHDRFLGMHDPRR